MAIRKSKVKQWGLRQNDGRFSSPEILVWEVAARSELSRLKGTFFIAAYILTVANGTNWSSTRLQQKPQ
eukprot:7975589-Heterocapsa_arctica.AAC.1